jgi:hypothetical protein
MPVNNQHKNFIDTELDLVQAGKTKITKDWTFYVLSDFGFLFEDTLIELQKPLKVADRKIYSKRRIVKTASNGSLLKDIIIDSSLAGIRAFMSLPFGHIGP